MLAVQECYISVCKEKDLLEESIRSREKEEKLIREESGTAMQKLRSELEAQHQASVMELKAVWSKEKEAEFQQTLTSHLASAEAAWKEELQKVWLLKMYSYLPHLTNIGFIQDLFSSVLLFIQMEKTWAQRLEEATREEHQEVAETSCQTDENEVSWTISAEELDSRLSAQRQQLQLESENVRRKAVEEARKQVQRELQEKHLDDMAKQVSAFLFYDCISREILNIF